MLDISKLASFISGIEFRPISWRAAHPYVLVDRFEDVHIAGIGDFSLDGVTSVAEPRPLPHIDDLKIDITEHNNLDEETHMKEDIFGVGSYLKFKICGVPSEMVKNLDPCQPILVGGISDREQKVGRISARFERHSLHIKSMRTNDDIIVSVGWRRYLTKLIYDPKDLSLDFTPEDKPRCATFWGHFATRRSGVVALQSLADSKAAFRNLATGKVLGFVKQAAVMEIRRPGTTVIEQYVIEEPRSLCPFKEPRRLKPNDPGWTGDNIMIPVLDHSSFNPYMTAPEPRDRVWTADTEESEKSRAHVVWGSRERKIADEDMRKKMSEVLEDKLKLTCQKRKTDEPRRAVIILERMYFGNRAEFHEAYQVRRRNIRNNIPRGMPTRFFEIKTGKTAVAN
ncbi:hypothetical protein MKW92_044781 [Papaver armeniacum]|nr:hypothetical protein MKW92_044781 [Papaver armeniacum]